MIHVYITIHGPKSVKLKLEDFPKDLDLDGRIILKLIFKKRDGRLRD